MILRRVKLGLLVYKLKDSEPMKSWADYAASFSVLSFHERRSTLSWLICWLSSE